MLANVPSVYRALGAVNRVARQLGIGPESLGQWVRQAAVDAG
jgi:transposase-like protein